MIETGSDVHQGGDMPIGRAALPGERIPMMELLVRHGAGVNGDWAAGSKGGGTHAAIKGGVRAAELVLPTRL